MKEFRNYGTVCVLAGGFRQSGNRHNNMNRVMTYLIPAGE